MAIAENAAIEFWGTKDTVTSSEAAVGDGNWSTGQAWTNDDDAPLADVVLDATFTATPTENALVHLHLRALDIGSAGTEDEPDPSAGWNGSYVGSFPIDNIATNQAPSIRVKLRNRKTSQNYEWFVHNEAGSQMNANWDLVVIPVTVGPHPA